LLTVYSSTKFSSLTKKDLTEIRRYWQFGGISQLNKADLVDALEKRIKNGLKDWLCNLTPENIAFLEKIIAEQKNTQRVEVTFRDLLPPALYNFYYRGIIDLIDNKQLTSVRIPADLLEELRDIINQAEFKKQIQENEEIITFVRGLLIYYGALSTSQIHDFYQKYYANKAESLDYLRLRNVIEEKYYSSYDIEKHSYYYLDPGVLNPEFVIEEIERRSSIDYYLPRKKEILYAGDNEIEKLNFVQRKFKKMLKKDFSINDDEAEDILWEMMLDIKNDFNSIKIFQKFADQYEFESEKQTDKFLRLLNELHNNTRMWILKGHTPTEVFEEARKHLGPLPKEKYNPGSVGENTVVKGEQTGRNDPCPCGSGKKYKKCCLGKD